MLKMVISVAVCLAYLCLATEGAAVSSNQFRQGNFNVPNSGPNQNGPRNFNVPNSGPNQNGPRNFNVPNAGPNQFGTGNFNNQPNAADPCPQRRLDCDRTACKETCLRMRFRTGMCAKTEVRCGEVIVDARDCKCFGDAAGAEFAYAGEDSNASNATNSDANSSNSSDSSSAAETSGNPQATSTAPKSTATTAVPKAAGANSANLAPASAGSGVVPRASDSTATGKASQ